MYYLLSNKSYMFLTSLITHPRVTNAFHTLSRKRVRGQAYTTARRARGRLGHFAFRGIANSFPTVSPCALVAFLIYSGLGRSFGTFNLLANVRFQP
jgi:hypothetical protein